MSVLPRHLVQYSKKLNEYLAALPARKRTNPAETSAPSLAAWFIGPKGENKKLLRRLVLKAVEAHCKFRESYFPDDPPYVTETIRRSRPYRTSIKTLETEYSRLLEQLDESVPFFSYRYQGHMNWDVTLPAILGFIATLLYNPNNVAAESSPTTTPLEMAVGDDLCEMLGYRIPTEQESRAGAIRPWGHITCDGSVANLEAMWAARNVKLYPIALATALNKEPSLTAACPITVPLATGEEPTLVNLDHWSLLNLRADDVLSLPARIQDQYSISTETLARAVRKYSVQGLGLVEFCTRYLDSDLRKSVILAPSTMHYSWPKSAALLGIGSSGVLGIRVDLDGRIDVGDFRGKLDDCLRQRRPVFLSVAVLGTTEEGAVDPLAKMLQVREEYRALGLEFTIHADAAWGGYFASILRERQTDSGDLADEDPFIGLSPYVEEQYRVLGAADSITVDPHKAGFIPYPAGGLCYRNSAMRAVVSFTAPVVYHGGADPGVGVFGIEGSKAGAAAAAVYLSHRIIRTDRSGYGRLLGQCVFNSKRLYAALITMANPDDPFIVVPFQRLPSERNGEPPEMVQKQLEFVRERIVPATNQQLTADPEAMTLLRELGSDQIIIAYAFNFKTHGVLNTSVARANRLNDEIFRSLSAAPGKGQIMNTPLFVTASEFDQAAYGDRLLNHFKLRLGINDRSGSALTFLISTTMDPWISETECGSFIPIVILALRQSVLNAINQMAESDS